MLLGGERISEYPLSTPKGIRLLLDLIDVQAGEGFVSCAVQKDAGDDPDVTDGVLVYAKVSRSEAPGIWIDGGEGVGRAAREGLAFAVGEAAINEGPRRMIRQELERAMRDFGFSGGLSAVISIPEGKNLAARTYNPRLGIEGGISVLGTTGIVEPMSESALIESIGLEIKVLAASGAPVAVITPGNYGETFLKETLGIDLKNAVKCSNFIGEALDFAAGAGFRGVLLVGHAGKLVKLAAGIMNTHSHTADGRMEILTAHAAMSGADAQTARELMGCITVDQAVGILDRAGLREAVFRSVMEKVEFHVKARFGDGCPIGAVLFSNRFGALGRTGEADRLIQRLKQAAPPEAAAAKQRLKP